jgi:arsenate reductase
VKKNIYFHNPRCRKSREGLQLINEKNIKIEIIEYLKTSPIEQELSYILNGLAVKPIALIRTQEKVFKELNLSKNDQRTDEEWIRIMVDNPILIERPILIYNGKVALGRPPENLLNILS